MFYPISLVTTLREIGPGCIQSRVVLAISVIDIVVHLFENHGDVLVLQEEESDVAGG